MDLQILKKKNRVKPLHFYLITDTHYFKRSLGAYGAEYEDFMDGDQKCFAETQAINEAIFEWLETADQADMTTRFSAGLNLRPKKRRQTAR